MPVFDGKFYRLPTVAVKTDTTGLTSTALSPGGIVAMIGTAEGGEPNAVTRFTDVNSAKSVLRGGDLFDAAEQAWQHGAQVIYLTRIGAATQATLSLNDASSAEVLTVTSQDYGSFVNDIKVKVETGTTSGKKVTVQFFDSQTNRTTVESVDNTANATEVATYFNTTLPSQLVTLTVVSSAGIPDNIGFTYLTDGDDASSPTTDEWSTALDLYRNEYVNILHPAGSTDAVVHALFQTHVETYSNQKLERTAIVGAAASDAIGDVDTADSLVYRAYNMNSDRMMLVAPGTDGNSAAFTAAKVVGLAAGYDVATPLTYKTITASSIAEKYTESEKDTLVKYGVTVIEEVPQGRRIVRGITTVQDPSESVEDSFKEYSVERIRDYVNSNIRSILETTYIGRKGVYGVESQMQATVGSILSRLKESEIILGYQNIQVTKDATNPKVFYITYQVAPISPINWIFCTTQLINTI
jgi:hypothetical protein